MSVVVIGVVDCFRRVLSLTFRNSTVFLFFPCFLWCDKEGPGRLIMKYSCVMEHDYGCVMVL